MKVLLAMHSSFSFFNYSLFMMNILILYLLQDRYLGCYNDDEGTHTRSLNGINKIYVTTSNPIGYCIEQCTKRMFLFAGLQVSLSFSYLLFISFFQDKLFILYTAKYWHTTILGRMIQNTESYYINN